MGLDRNAPELVQDRRDRLALKAGAVARPLLCPELAHDGVRQTRDDLGPQALVRQEPVQVEQRRALVVCDGEDGVAEHVLEARSPERAPLLPEDGDQVGREERRVGVQPLTRSEDVERDRVVNVRRAKEERAVRLVRVKVLKRLRYQGTMRIENGQAVPGAEILRDEVREQRALSGPGLTEHVEVAKSVGFKETEALVLPSPGRLPEDEERPRWVQIARMIFIHGLSLVNK